MKKLIEYIATSLTDNPEQVKVNEVTSEQGTVFRLVVAKDDLGKIIGRQGRTARALRTLLNAVSAKEGRHVTLEIQD